MSEYKAKIFKSGNSLALRIPKAMGLEEGAEMVLRELQRGFIVEPAAGPKRRIDVSGFAGKAPWLKPSSPEVREFEERPSTIAARKRLEEGGGNA
jgi:antitoxin VapB